VHRYVEQMDKYYGNVCELDIIFNFQKAYFILDELLLAGELQESSKKNVLRVIGAQDSLEDMEVSVNLSRARVDASARILYHHTPADHTYDALAGRGRLCHQDRLKGRSRVNLYLLAFTLAIPHHLTSSRADMMLTHPRARAGRFRTRLEGREAAPRRGTDVIDLRVVTGLPST